MKLEGDYEFEAAVQDVWDALFDPAVLAAALPGCDKLELVDGAYLGELKVKVGPVQGKFSGKVDLLDKLEPKSYRMVIDGRGQQGFVKANATIELAPAGEGKTKLTYVSDAQIGGKIATVGQRLVEASAKAIVKQSLEGLNENVKIRAAAYRERAKAEAPAEAKAEAAAPSVTPDGDAEAKAAVAADAKAEATADAKAADADKPEADATSEPAANPEPADKPEATIEATAEATAEAKPEANTDDQKPAPAIEYKKADAGKMASAVAKEVGKTMAPTIVGVLLVLALIIYFIFMR